LPPLDASRIVHGDFGKIFIDGEWESNFNHLEAKVAINKEELHLSGDNWVRHKRGTKKGTGAMAGFKVTSRMLEREFGKFEVISKIDDPEAFGYERIRLMNVMVDELELANWTAGETVKENVPFTFEGYELLDPIRAS
jgi:hypothetical protein